jgi:predicted extracellular nuclease
MDAVRTKKKTAAEYLARWVDERQKANPAERIILLGDFNAFQFNDGVMDMIGTDKGSPAAKDAVIMPTEDLVARDMINLVEVTQRQQRYSNVFDGNAQTLDHILISETLKNTLMALDSYASMPIFRIDANDDHCAERFSDHDPAIAYFSLDAQLTRSSKLESACAPVPLIAC